MGYTLKVILGQYDFSMIIEHKVTILCGDSAIGKTTFVRMTKSKGVKINSLLEIKELPNKRPKEGWLNYLKFNSGERVLFYSDEETLSFDNNEEFKEFQIAITNIEAYFLLITRNTLAYIPHGYLNFYTLKSIGRKYTAIPIYQMLSKQEVDYSQVKTVYTEDENSGNNFFKSFVGNTVLSTSGVSSIKDMLKTVCYSLFIIDGKGCGPNIKSIMDSLQHCSTNQILCIDSFEIMVLKSEFMDAWEEPEPLCSNVEKYGTKLLSSVMLELGQSYSKGECPKCFTQNCCYSYSKCRLYKRGNKQQMIAGSIYDGLMSIDSQTISQVSSTKSDREIAQEIINEDSTAIVSLSSQFSNEFKLQHPAIDFNNPLSIQMHCQMLLELGQI